MLDEKDLQAIAQLMDQKLQPINCGVGKIEVRLDKLEEDVGVLKEDVGILKEDVKSLKKRTDQIERQMNIRFDYLVESIEKVDRRLLYNAQLLKQTDKEIMRDMDALRA